MKKSLTKLPYARILTVVAQSKEPLSSQQIIKQMITKRLLPRNNSGKDVFRMLKQLVPQDYIFDKRTYLFSLNELLSTIPDRRNKPLRKIADLLQPIVDKEDIITTSNTITRYKRKDDECLYVSIKHDQNSQQCIVIKLGPTHEHASSSISFCDGNKKKIMIEKEIVYEKINGNNIRAYIKKENNDKTKFLDATLTEKARRKHPLIDKYWDYLKDKEINSVLTDIPAEISFELIRDHDCIEVIFNTKYWRYQINLRGFLMCLLALVSSNQNTMLHDLISSKPILQTAPFLMHHKDFERVGFNIIRVLKEIATEFQHELDYNSQPQIQIKDKNSYLLHKVTERYFAKVESYFNVVKQSQMAAILPKKIGVEQYADIQYKINEYRLYMLTLLKKWTEDQREYIHSAYSYYHDEYEKLYNPYTMLIRRQQEIIKKIYPQIIRRISVQFCYLWTTNMNSDLIIILCNTLGFIY
jgi:hypothetical protein